MPVTVTLVTGSPYEAKLRDRLLGLFERYELRKWQFTDRVQIEANAPSHSHPILTLTARFATDYHLLSTYLHEQIHWFTVIPANAEADHCVEGAWKRRYPISRSSTPKGVGARRVTIFTSL
jgi:hypothetical protein